MCDSRGFHKLLILGGDLSRVDGRSVKPYWTLLFNDILLFAKVSRDRVLFITEEPVPLIHISESMFNVRKKCKGGKFIKSSAFPLKLFALCQLQPPSSD